MSIRKYIDIVEAPIDNWHVDPDMNAREKEMISKFTGYKQETPHWSDSDKRAINDPVNIEKTKLAFMKTPYHFNMYFWQSTQPDYDDFLQQGLVDKEWMTEHLGQNVVDYFETIDTTSAINIIHTNNLSDEHKINLRSPWMVAHRCSHALIMGNDALEQAHIIQYEFEKFVKTVSKVGYNYTYWWKGDSYNAHMINQDYMQMLMKEFGEALGTMNSARSKKLVQASEWVHETFAQYLLKGKVTFNALPPHINDYPKDNSLTTDPVKLEKVQKLWATFPKLIGKRFNLMLKHSVGKFFVI